MGKRTTTQPTISQVVLGELFRFGKQRAVHGVVDKFAAQILRDPDIREHLAQSMYERENGTRAMAWSKLADDDRELWLSRVDCVVREISSMTEPKLG